MTYSQISLSLSHAFTCTSPLRNVKTEQFLYIPINNPNPAMSPHLSVFVFSISFSSFSLSAVCIYYILYMCTNVCTYTHFHILETSACSPLSLLVICVSYWCFIKMLADASSSDCTVLPHFLSACLFFYCFIFCLPIKV